jgi:hypothetical protein
MANLHNEFQTFHERVALFQGKKESLTTSRDAVRDRIRKHFREQLKLKVPEFRSQGSFEMDTTVNPLDGEFDVDDGVYLQHLDESDCSTWPTPETIHKWLVDATDGHTNEKPIDKRTCVRVRYAGQYHVDLPSYGKLNGENLLAEKGEKGWHRSDPTALTNWFNDLARQRENQMRRSVRFVKAWADYQCDKRGKMPSSLILTVLVAQNFQGHERDDVCLANTVRVISDSVGLVFCVYNPVDASEVLTARLSEEEKQRFQEAIADLANDASKAVNNDSQQEASKLWRAQLGDRFPLVQEDDEDTKQRKDDANRLAAFYIPKKPIKPWGWS